MTAAYGVRFGTDVGPGHWPRWDVEVSEKPADDSPGLSIWPDRARSGIPGSGEVLLEREARRIAIAVRERPSDAALVHPWLAPAAVVIAHWARRASLHAAAVVIDGVAWALLGDRAAGKSTTAALLCERGCEPFTDDVLVLAGNGAFAGPPSIDLRAEPAAVLGGEPLVDRDRWRLHLDRRRYEAPLAGFVALEWAESPAIMRLGAADRLPRLEAQVVFPGTGAAMLDLLALPMLLAQRPLHLPGAPGFANDLLAAIVQEGRGQRR